VEINERFANLPLPAALYLHGSGSYIILLLLSDIAKYGIVN
jgi:hypothetical protein